MKSLLLLVAGLVIGVAGSASYVAIAKPGQVAGEDASWERIQREMVNAGNPFAKQITACVRERLEVPR